MSKDGMASGLSIDGRLEHVDLAMKRGSRDEVRAAIDVVSDDELIDWLATDAGQSSIGAVVERMPTYYVPDVVQRDARIRWKIELSALDVLEFDLCITSVRCWTEAVDYEQKADSLLVLGAVPFIEMASSRRSGIDLLLTGELVLQGDVQLAMLLQTLFNLTSG